MAAGRTAVVMTLCPSRGGELQWSLRHEPSPGAHEAHTPHTPPKLRHADSLDSVCRLLERAGIVPPAAVTHSGPSGPKNKNARIESSDDEGGQPAPRQNNPQPRPTKKKRIIPTLQHRGSDLSQLLKELANDNSQLGFIVTVLQKCILQELDEHFNVSEERASLGQMIGDDPDWNAEEDLHRGEKEESSSEEDEEDEEDKEDEEHKGALKTLSRDGGTEAMLVDDSELTISRKTIASRSRQNQLMAAFHFRQMVLDLLDEINAINVANGAPPLARLLQSFEDGEDGDIIMESNFHGSCVTLIHTWEELDMNGIFELDATAIKDFQNNIRLTSFRTKLLNALWPRLQEYWGEWQRYWDEEESAAMGEDDGAAALTLVDATARVSYIESVFRDCKWAKINEPWEGNKIVTKEGVNHNVPEMYFQVRLEGKPTKPPEDMVLKLLNDAIYDKYRTYYVCKLCGYAVRTKKRVVGHYNDPTNCRPRQLDLTNEIKGMKQQKETENATDL